MNFEFPVPTADTFVFQLLKNGVAVPGFALTFNAGDTVKFIATAPVAYAPGDIFDLQVTGTAGPGGTTGSFSVAATIGVE